MTAIAPRSSPAAATLVPVGRVGRLLLPYAIVVAEYLLAAALLYTAISVMTPPPRSHTCVDACWGTAFLLTLLAISGAAVLSVGLLVAVALVAVRQRRGRRAGPETEPWRRAAGAASRAATRGVLWGLVALPGLWCVTIGGLRML